MRFHKTISMILYIAALVPAASACAANVSDFAVFNYLDNNGNVLLPGRLYVPTDFATNPNIPRPIILFFHGSGESGTNNTSQVNGNIDNLLTAAKNRGAFLYAPQTNFGWSDPTILSWAMTMVDRAITDYHADTDRFYVTGLSLGGGGTWNFLDLYPDRVAAAVPICGSPPAPYFQPATILHEPIWAFHGRFDSTVPVGVTRDIIDSLLTEAGQTPPTYLPPNTFAPHIQYDFPPLDLHYTDMRGGHGIWPEVYNDFSIDNEYLYDWLFSHTQVPEPATLSLAALAFAALCFRQRRSRPFRAQRC